MKQISNEYFNNNRATYDSLTKVISRKSMFNYIEYLVKNNKKFVLFFIDFDDFKSINDVLGHNAGDEALIECSKRMDYIFKKYNGILGRYGGDEFFAIVEGLEEYEDVWNIANDLNEYIRTDNSIKGIEKALPAGKFTITTGIARFPHDANNLDDLFELADRALYRGKQKGKNCFIVYNKDLHQNIFKDREAKKLDSKNIIDYVFGEMTDETKDVESRLISVFKFVGYYYNVSLVAKNYDNKFEILYSNGSIKNAKYIDEKEFLDLKSNEVDTMVFMYINKLGDAHKHLKELFEEQNVHASLLITCETKNKKYGYFRIDAKYERIWTKEEKIIFQIIANLYALVLEYSK